MKITYVHASKFGNGAAVAEEFKTQLEAKGVEVDVHHIRDVPPSQLPPADLYLFSSPGRFGRPVRGMRRFLRGLTLPVGTPYALLTTEAAPRLDTRTGRVPSDDELVQRGQRVRPLMHEILESKGMVQVAEDKVYVTKMRGPLEEGWQKKVADLAARLHLRV